MTATTDLAPTPTPALPAPPARSALPAEDRASSISAGGVLRSEWVKFRSLRSTTATLAAAAAVLLLIGVISSAILGGLVADATSDGDTAASAPFTGVLLAQLLTAVLGVLVLSSEYATGLIRTTMTAVPSRLPVLWAKAAVLTAVTLPTMLAATVVTFVTGQALISGGTVPTTSLGDPGVVRALVGTAVYLAAVALIGLALAALLRATAAAISAVFGLVFLLPALGMLLPASWRDTVLQYLPSNAGSAFTSVVPDPGLLSPTSGALVLLLWVAVPMAAAAVVLRRRSV